MSSLAPARLAGRANDAPAPPTFMLRVRGVRRRWLLLALFGLVLVAPPMYLAHTGGALATGYTIQRLQAERNAWKARNQQLEAELAKARSLAWIESEAVGRLGMQRPSAETVVRVDIPPPPIVSSSRQPERRELDRTAELQPTQAWLDGVGAFLAQLVVGR